MKSPTPAQYVILGFTAAALGLAQLLVGGVRPAYALLAVGMAAIAGVFTIALRRGPRLPPRRYCVAAALLLVGYVVGRAWFSPVPFLARADVVTALGGLIIYLVGAGFVSGMRARFALIVALMLAIAVQMAVGIWQFKDQQNFMLLPWVFRPDYGFKASGFFASPNHFSALLGMLGLCCLSICCWGRISLSARAFAFYGFIVCLTGTALTGSRGGYYSIAAGLLFFTAVSMLLAQRFNRPYLFGLAMATALVLTGVVALVLRLVVASDIYENRLRHVHEPGGKVRLLASAALAQHARSPIVGTGAGTFLYESRVLRPPLLQNDPQHAHNDALELLAEYGWIGAGLAALFLAAHAVSTIAGLRRILGQKLKPTISAASNELALTLGAASAVCVILVHAMMDFPFHVPALAWVAAFLFSILANPTTETSSARHRREPGRLALAIPAFSFVLLSLVLWRWPVEFLAERARLALRDRDPAAALRLARAAVQRDPAHADAHFVAGEAAHYLSLEAPPPAARELLEQAAASFESGLAAFPQDLRLLLKLGRTLDDLSRSAEAEPVFARALAAAPHAGMVRSCVALHWHRRGELARASELYREAVTLGETQLSAAGLADLERDFAIARENEPFADFLPDPERPPVLPK